MASPEEMVFVLEGVLISASLVVCAAYARWRRLLIGLSVLFLTGFWTVTLLMLEGEQEGFLHPVWIWPATVILGFLTVTLISLAFHTYLRSRQKAEHDG